MAYKLSKKFRFESAHRLALNYCGKCANIHGHSWNGAIHISGNTLDEYGFLLDFADVKGFTRWVEDKYDHKLLLHKSDTDLIEVCNKNGWAVEQFEDNPTSETIARILFEEAEKFFARWPEIKVDFIRIEETCTSECVYDGK